MTIERIFQINKEKKADIQRNYIESSMLVGLFSAGLLIAIIVFTVMFAMYGFGLKDTFLISDITASDYGQKNWVLVLVILITVDVILLFLWCIQKIVVWEIFGRYIDQRINESLCISNELIEYGYQNLVGSAPGDRIIVQIPVNSIRQVRIDRDLKKIEIDGMISSKYYENYAKRRTKAPEENGKEGSFVIFDYFEPELISLFTRGDLPVKII